MRDIVDSLIKTFKIEYCLLERESHLYTRYEMLP